MAAAEAKLILLKDESRVMTFEEVYEQFKAYIYARVKHWSYKFDPEEVYQLGFYGLFKAFRTYNSGKCILFMTYCARIIENEILMLNRRSKKDENTVSLFVIAPDTDGSVELFDRIADKTNYEDVAINEAGFGLFGEALNKLNAKEKEILTDYYLNNIKQRQLASKYGITQSYISRLVKAILPKKLKRLLKLKKEDFYPSGSAAMEYRSRSPILNIKRELDYEEQYNKPGCKVSKMTPEQLQYYKSLPYEEGKEYIEKVLRGEEGEITMKKIEPKITRDQLLEECRKLGTSREAQRQIAAKYNLTPGTVNNYIFAWKIHIEIKQDKQEVNSGEIKSNTMDVFTGASGVENVQAGSGHTDDPEVELTSESPISDNLNPVNNKATAAFQQFKTSAEIALDPLPRKKLKVISQTLQGDHFLFGIHDDVVEIKAVEGETVVTPIYVEQRLLRPLIEELTEIAEVVRV